MNTQESPALLVTIPNCTATHVLGSTTILLASGELSLIKSTSSSLAAPSVGAPATAKNIEASSTSGSASVLPHTPAQPTPVFTLQIGTLAFPLLKDTLFGTTAASPFIYLFAPELGPAGQGSQGGYVKLELPKEAEAEGSEAAESQEEFEKALIGEGLLKEGWEAVGDEIGRGAREGLGAGAEGLDRAAESQKSHPPPSNPTTFSPTTHSFLESSAQATESASEWTKGASQTLSDAASGAGKWIGGKISGLADVVSSSLETETGRVPPEALEEDDEDWQNSTTSDVVAGAKVASKGVSTGASSLTSSFAQTTNATITSHYGTETAAVASKAGETVKNVGGVAKDVVLGTSAVVKGAEGVVAAVGEGSKGARREDSTEEVSLE